MRWRPALWLKLFLFQAALMLLALGALLWAQQRSFGSGLLDYLNGLEQGRAERLVAALSTVHARAGDWLPLARHPGLWRQLVIRSAQDEALADADAAGGPLEAPAPRFPGRRPERPDPPGGEVLAPALARDGPADFLRRLALLDADGLLLRGSPEVVREDHARRWSIDAAGQRAGTLLLAPLPTVQSSAELRFGDHLRRDALLALALVLLPALLAAWWLARRLLQPVQAVAAAARRLAAGDEAARAPLRPQDAHDTLAQDFNHLADTLAAHRQARQRWIADISHELRTPLAILIGELQALEDGVRRFEPASLGSLQAEAGRIGQLVEDLYQLAQADAGRLVCARQPLDLVVLLREALARQDAALREAGLALETSWSVPTAVVAGDPARLHQLLANLIGNSVRYTARGGRLRLHLAAADGGWLLTVEDSAPGVPDATLPHLFERLYRVEHSRARATGGAGLGLAIAREIVLAHGGRISAAHSPLGGLAILVHLPATPPCVHAS